MTLLNARDRGALDARFGKGDTMAKRTVGDIEKIWSSVEGIKKLSDRVIGVGPIGRAPLTLAAVDGRRIA